MTIKLSNDPMLSIGAHREALLRKLVAADRLVEAQLDWAMHHATEKDLEELLAIDASTIAARPAVTPTPRQLAVASILGDLSPTQLARGVVGAAAKRKLNDDADETTLDRIAQLTRTKPDNGAKTKQKLIAGIAKKHTDATNDKRVTVDDMDQAARMAGVTTEQVARALAAKGWKISETGHGWEPPDPNDDDDKRAEVDGDDTP